MLFEFISSHREELIALTRSKVAKRLAPQPTDRELNSGVPLFLDQLAEMLRRPASPTTGPIDRGAAVHGAALLSLGYTVAQVVHDYGDICQAITELAGERRAPITIEEFHTLNLSLDNAIAEAVTEYTRLRDRSKSDDETERAGAFAHELRNRISAAQLAFLAIRSGRAAVGGSVAGVIARNLHGLTALVDRAFVEARVDSGNVRRQRIHLHQLIEEAEVDGTLEAESRGVSLSVGPIDGDVDVEGDPQIVAGAVANLLQNAFKFTPRGGRIALTASVIRARVEIRVEDECGGLPPGRAEELFGAFRQRGTNRSGLGLGLFISRKGIEASGGVIRVRDLPGRGCVFTIDLPRMI
jgi:signal transduction histidine kinase